MTEFTEAHRISCNLRKHVVGKQDVDEEVGRKKDKKSQRKDTDTHTIYKSWKLKIRLWASQQPKSRGDSWCHHLLQLWSSRSWAIWRSCLKDKLIKVRKSTGPRPTLQALMDFTKAHHAKDIKLLSTAFKGSGWAFPTFHCLILLKCPKFLLKMWIV